MEGEKGRETKGQFIFGQRNSSEKYSERRGLALKVKECKQEYVAQLESSRRKTHWDRKRKCDVQDTPKQGYLTKAVQKLCPAVKESKMFAK